MSFDYGADVVDHYDLKVWPEQGEFTALLDADMLPYIVGYTTQEERGIRAFHLVSEITGKSKDDLTYRDLLEHSPYFREKARHLHFLVNSWTKNSGADSCRMFATDSDANFRINVAFTKPYKGQRKSSKPMFFKEIREYMLATYPVTVAHGNEADDLMAMAQYQANLEACEQDPSIFGSEWHKENASTIIVSKDKDLRIVAGWHFEPDHKDKTFVKPIGELLPEYKDKEVDSYEEWWLVDKKPMNPEECRLEGIEPDRYTRGKNKGLIKTKRVKVGTEVAQVVHKLKGNGLKFFFAQLIMGDSVDNYDGVKGCGATTALELLDHLDDPQKMADAVLGLYIDKYTGGTNEAIWWTNYRYPEQRELVTAQQLMCEQGRLAWMQHWEGDMFWPDMELPEW